MIYQIKITLLNSRPPIWRRLLVNENMLLSELHETIQIAFNWMDRQMHCFEARKTNGVRLTEKHLSIGVNDEELLHFMDNYDYDERKEKLSNWLKKEKDKLLYIYDFGDEWRHEIVLEKIIGCEPGMVYPYCVKAVRKGAQENGGGVVEEVLEANREELEEIINFQLKGLAEKLPATLPGDHENKADWERLFQLAKEFKHLAPWKWLNDDQIFAVELPNGEYAFCSIMGAAGQEFGIAAFIGHEGLTYLKRLLLTEGIDETALYENRSLIFELCNRKELSKRDYELIKKTNISFRGKKSWPIFRAMEPGYFPWYLTDEEAAVMTIILERAVEIGKRTKESLTIQRFGAANVCFAQKLVPAPGGGTKWEDSFISLSSAKPNKEAQVPINEVHVHRLKKTLKKFHIPIEIGIFHSPTPVREHINERPFLPTVFVAAEKEHEMALFHDMIEPEDRDQRIQGAFLKMLEKLNYIPVEIWLEKKIVPILAPITKKLAITVIEKDTLQIIEEIKRTMYKQMG